MIWHRLMKCFQKKHWIRKKHQIATEKIEITTEPDRLLVYFYGDDDLFMNYGVLISKG